MVVVDEATDLLRRAPDVVRSLYDGLDETWLHAADPGEWSAHTVLVHMVTLEDHAWVHRIAHAIDHPGAELPPIDRGGPDPDRDVAELVDAFTNLRRANLGDLANLRLDQVEAIHHQLGPVTTDQILATWAIHDLNHLAQAMAAISSRYRDEVGPFIPNLGILHR